MPALGDPPHKPRQRVLLLLLAVGGLLLNGLLLHWMLSDPFAGIVGCGGVGGCHDVLASRGSQVFGLPIPVLGILVYGLLVAALVWRKPLVAAFCYGAISGSAIWLVIVQAFLLQHFCPWCMATHGVGVLLVVLAWTVNPCAGKFRQGLQQDLRRHSNWRCPSITAPLPQPSGSIANPGYAVARKDLWKLF